MKILTVCLGNICRSPMAEGILRDKVKERGMEISTDSAGTANYHVGQEPDKRAVAAMKRHGIDITDLRGMHARLKHFDEFDLILTMDEENYKNVIALANNEEQRSRVKRMLSFGTKKEVTEVPDPYYGGDSGFEYVFDLLDDASDDLLNRIERGEL